MSRPLQITCTRVVLATPRAIMPWTLNNVDAAHKCLATAGETLYIVASDDGDLVATQVAPKGVSLILGTLGTYSIVSGGARARHGILTKQLSTPMVRSWRLGTMT